MREQGRVITVHDGTVDVKMEVSAACGGCDACAHGSGGETVMQGVRDSLGATVGDTVDVTIPDTVRKPAAIAVFVVPVAAMMIGYLAGFLLGRWAGISPDVAGLVTALLAANIAFIGARLAGRRLAASDRFSPRVSAIIARGSGRPGRP